MTGAFRVSIKWIGVVWCVAVTAGMAYLTNYQSIPGAEASTPTHWPTTAIDYQHTGLTLVMLLHPRCSCSRASLAELERLVAHYPERMQVKLFFSYPESEAADWVEGELWQIAERIPNAELFKDKSGVQAAAFGATTSGHVALYNESGELRFSGGITPARAHEGSSDGQLAIAEIIERNVQSHKRAATFGCEL